LIVQVYFDKLDFRAFQITAYFVGGLLVHIGDDNFIHARVDGQVLYRHRSHFARAAQYDNPHNSSLRCHF
jgi:hypothetical protein